MAGVISTILKPLKFMSQNLQIASTVIPSMGIVKPDCFLLSSIRTKVRCYFPRPNEVRRVRRHGWEARMSTKNGRKIIMRRLLKGRYVLTH